MKILFFAVALFLQIQLFAQNEIKLMHYNLLYYDKITDYCTESNNSIEQKNEALRTIFEYVNPDIISVNEMNASAASVDLLLNETLNINGITYYSRRIGTGTYSINAMYYNNSKFRFVSQKSFQIPLGSNNGYIDAFNMMALTEPETPITFFSMHPKAGSTGDDENDRATATDNLMYNLSLGFFQNSSNYVLLGDLNFYDASEEGFQNLINYSNVNYRFYDPINQIGTWTNNSNYADYHTQSTHYSSNGCAASGGMDDRFDFIMVSKAIENQTDGVFYNSSDYVTIGQDGNHFNTSLTNGTNTSAPTEVIDALYTMSDHLPVTLVLQFENNFNSNFMVSDEEIVYQNPISESFEIRFTTPISNSGYLKIYNISGQEINYQLLQAGATRTMISASQLPEGLYFLEISTEKIKTVLKIIKQ